MTAVKLCEIGYIQYIQLHTSYTVYGCMWMIMDVEVYMGYKMM